MTEIKKLKRVVLKEELVALTGNFVHAVVLNQMIYWSERVKDSDQFIKEEMERIRKFSDGSQETPEDIENYLRNGWIYKKAQDLVDECMGICSRQTMSRVLNDLVKSGWLEKRKNPKYKWDRTWQYRVNLLKIQHDLQKIGYALEGYQLLNDESSNAHFEHLRSQDEQAIPEITTEITNNNNTTTTTLDTNVSRKIENQTKQQKQNDVVVDKPESINELKLTDEEEKSIKDFAKANGVNLSKSNVLELWEQAKGDIERIENGILAAIEYAKKTKVSDFWALIKQSVVECKIPSPTALDSHAPKYDFKPDDKYKDLYLS